MKNTSKLLSLLLCVCLLLAALPPAAIAKGPDASDVTFWYDIIDFDAKLICVNGADDPLPETLVIPSKINGYTVVEIGWDAFAGRDELREVALPDAVTYIGGNAFGGCANLEHVTLPASLETIDNEAFANCTALQEIVIPDGVSFLGNYAFCDCESLQNVTLPAGLTFFCEYVFAWCGALEKIELPDSLEDLGTGAFEGCSSLKEIVWPSSLEYVSDYAFSGCSALETLTLPEGITGVGPGAFDGCAALTEVDLPDSLTGINEHAFAGCEALTTIQIPANVDYVNTEAFLSCPAMTELTVDPENPFFTTVDGVLYDKDVVALIVYPTGKPGASFRLPDSVYSIEGRWAFSGTALQSLDLNQAGFVAPGAISSSGISKITKAKDNDNFVIENNVLYNDNGEFLLAYPGGLTAASFTVPDRVWNVEDSAFITNQYLKKVVLPEGVQQVMQYAFAGSAVAEVVLPSTVLVLDYGGFEGCGYLKKANIPEGVTAVPGHMFNGCMALEQVSLPDSLMLIGESAFGWCSSLKNIDLPEGLSNIEYGAFMGCESLKNVKLPASVAFIEETAFDGTPWFETMPEGPVYLNTVLYAYKGEIPEDTAFTVKDGTTMIAAHALAWQWGLSDLIVPDSLLYVGNEAVDGTRWLDEILPDGPVYIGSVFYRYKGEMTEKSFALKEGTVAVTPGAFWNFYDVETLSIPSSLAEVNDYDLFDLHSLKAFKMAKDGEYCRVEDGVLFSVDGTQLLCYPPQKADKSYEVPFGVETLAWHAFMDNEFLEELTVHDTVRSAMETVENCPSLKDVYYGGVMRTWDEMSGSYDLLQNVTELHITHEDVFKDAGSVIVVAPDTQLGDVMFTLSGGAGVAVTRPDGGPVTPEDAVCSGMELTMPEGEKDTLVVLGDADGDGQITSADARLALRYSVKLDNPVRWQLNASRVTGGEKTTSEDARLILRSSVSLENAYDWFRAYEVK